MSKKFLYLILLVPNLLFAQRTDKKLEGQVSDLLKDIRGKGGIYIKSFRTNKVVAINADSLFPTASMIKIPILIGIMDKIEKGELSYHQKLVYSDSLLYPGVDILGSFKNGESIELSKVLMLMLSTSDNTASLWLQGLAGSGERINRILDSIGFSQTRVNSRTPGRASAREAFGWGQTTPKEMATLLSMIYEGKIISRGASERMLRLLGRNYWDEVALSQIPPEVFVASKNGAVDESRSETVFVNAPHGAYIFSFTTKDLADTSWLPNNPTWVLTRKLSKLLWNYFEPRSKWQPSASVEGKYDF